MSFLEVLRLVPSEDYIVIDFYASGVTVYDEATNIYNGYKGSDIMMLPVSNIHCDGESLVISVEG